MEAQIYGTTRNLSGEYTLEDLISDWGKALQRSQRPNYAKEAPNVVRRAYRKLLDSAFFGPDDSVVLFNTGSGLKYQDTLGEPQRAALPTSRCSNITISAGVPAGTNMPTQKLPSISGKPASAIVGTSGSAESRCPVATG